MGGERYPVVPLWPVRFPPRACVRGLSVKSDKRARRETPDIPHGPTAFLAVFRGVSRTLEAKTTLAAGPAASRTLRSLRSLRVGSRLGR